MTPAEIEHELRVAFMLAITHDEGTPQCNCHACVFLRDLQQRFWATK